MNRAIIIHGYYSKKEFFVSEQDSPSNGHWLPWLQLQLLRNDVLAQTPEMPRSYEPDYYEWKKEFEKLSPDKNTLLVGHSCGGGFLVRWLSESAEHKAYKVVLIAPWLDIERKHSPLFDFDIRSDISVQSESGIDVLFSTNDMPEINSTIDVLRRNTEGLKYNEFSGYGHFCLGDMKTREFPELLNICLEN